ncbi:tetratricopeptide repeat protein [Hymenobacter cellulosilyticus]|uniref:Tetratricopeptide repeat protein n=1 Tax=Hymenobacter cellulosilyticus TaxID=2932248 RepID=A0A8T9QFI1_9BACT|nr:tetratricopeptide repeat protein [Hymenobacter cellulosilyticus]UOQ74309.1 tetratricopeptide repeat protein [Hymenobacter cellulosilyticus]
MAALPNPSDLQPLLDALAFSPENVPLRRHVATLLRQAARLAEAEEHYRTGLRQAPADVELQLGLAETYSDLQKTSEALVVLEELLRDHPDHGRAHLLHARLLARAGGPPDEARAAYQQALQLDGSLRDPSLDEQLGLRPAAQPAGGGAPADYSASVSADYGIDERALFAGLEKPKITFNDVGGMDAVKEEIRLKIIHPLQFPDLYKAYGKAAGADCCSTARPAAAKPTWPGPRPAR